MATLSNVIREVKSHDQDSTKFNHTEIPSSLTPAERILWMREHPNVLRPFRKSYEENVRVLGAAAAICFDYICFWLTPNKNGAPKVKPRVDGKPAVADSYERIAGKTGLSYKQVRTAIIRLQESGFITVSILQWGSRLTKHYQVPLLKDFMAANSGANTCTQKVGENDKKSLHSAPRPCPPGHPAHAQKGSPPMPKRAVSYLEIPSLEIPSLEILRPPTPINGGEESSFHERGKEAEKVGNKTQVGEGIRHGEFEKAGNMLGGLLNGIANQAEKAERERASSSPPLSTSSETRQSNPAAQTQPRREEEIPARTPTTGLTPSSIALSSLPTSLQPKPRGETVNLTRPNRYGTRADKTNPRAVAERASEESQRKQQNAWRVEQDQWMGESEAESQRNGTKIQSLDPDHARRVEESKMQRYFAEGGTMKQWKEMTPAQRLEVLDRLDASPRSA